MKTNWNLIFDTNRTAVVEFAEGGPSSQFTKSFTKTEASGEVRTLIRNKGTDKARRMAKDAVRRRVTA